MINILSRIVVLHISLLGISGLATGQLRDCADDDLACLEDNYSNACYGPSATADSCRRWLTSLQQRPGAESPAVRLVAAHTYLALADITDAPDSAQRLREQGIRIYRTLLAENPSNIQALYALAAISPSKQERIRLLRRVISIDPTEQFALESLASEIAQSRAPDDLLRAAELLEQAYANQTGLNKWRLAAAAFSRYRQSGFSERAAAFREKVRKDIGLDRARAELSGEGAVQLNRASHVLQMLCNSDVMSIIGAADCLENIDRVWISIPDVDDQSKAQQLVNEVSTAIISASQAGWLLDNADPNWRTSFLNWLDSVLIKGFESTAVYFAYATLATGNDRLEALEQAAALAPMNGQAAYRLGLEYFDLGRWKKAEEQLKKAQKLLPPFQQGSINYYLNRAIKESQGHEKTAE